MASDGNNDMTTMLSWLSCRCHCHRHKTRQDRQGQERGDMRGALVRRGDNTHCLHTVNVIFTQVPMLMSRVRIQVTMGAGIAAGHKNVTHTHTHTSKGIKTHTGYPYPCQSLPIHRIR